jgi:glycosyltransferase involved in cell wall biosynthesis
MKASIFIATYNRNKELLNALHSLSKQKTSFPIEYCIIDDHSDVDPEPLIRKFLPDAKYKRLKKRVGFVYSQSYCYDLISPDSDIIVLQAADVIYTTNNILEELCKGTDIGVFTLAEVVDIEIESDVCEKFNEKMSEILNEWNSHIKFRWLKIDNDVDFNKRYKSYTKYTGRNINGQDLSWLFFAGAIRREDLEDLGFSSGSVMCDAVLNQILRINEYEANILDHLKVIHQRHSKIVYPCPVIDKCLIRCIRKTDSWKLLIKEILTKSGINYKKISDPILLQADGGVITCDSCKLKFDTNGIIHEV